MPTRNRRLQTLTVTVSTCSFVDEERRGCRAQKIKTLPKSQTKKKKTRRWNVREAFFFQHSGSVSCAACILSGQYHQHKISRIRTQSLISIVQNASLSCSLVKLLYCLYRPYCFIIELERVLGPSTGLTVNMQLRTWSISYTDTIRPRNEALSAKLHSWRGCI